MNEKPLSRELFKKVMSPFPYFFFVTVDTKSVQGYLAHKNHHRALGIALLYRPAGRQSVAASVTSAVDTDSVQIRH